MSFEANAVGITAAELMDDLAEEYLGAEEVELGVVAVVAEVNYKSAESDEWFTNVEYRCSDGRRWVQAGLFDTARRAARQSGCSCSSEE